MISSPTISSPTTIGPPHRNSEMEWPGCHRWAVLMDEFREHFYGVEEWWAVKRVGSGEMGISPPPTLMSMDDYERPRQSAEPCEGVGFASGWTLLTS